jgi:transcriptional regulator with XRE-family HTH domain
LQVSFVYVSIRENIPEGRIVQIPRLKEWREARALTQVELAELADVSSRSVAGYEAGAGARPPTVRKLAEALGVEVGDLRGDPEHPLAEALPLQEKLFNGGAKERGAFIDRCRRHVAARVAHYENRLAVAENGGFFAGYDGVKALRDDAFEEFSQLLDLQNGELKERWLDDSDVPDAVKEDLGFALVEAQRPFVRMVGRIGDRVNELAETPTEKDEAARLHDELAELRRRKEASHEHKSKTA